MPKHSVLIVDDEVNILNSLSRLLRSDDLEVITAESAHEGLEKLKNCGGTDVVISDNRLPDIAGIEFLVKVRLLFPDIIRILITGYPDLDSAIDAINRGQVYRYIAKPWDAKELKAIVVQAIGYFDVLRDNRALIKIAKQQAEWLSALKKKYPQISQSNDLDKSTTYIIDEKNISESLAEFLKKYYPKKE